MTLSAEQCRSARPEDADDPGRGLARILVLPDSLDEPSGLGEVLVGVDVPFLVALDLVGPVPTVGSVNPSPVVRATMPEASIDEDRDALPTEDDVCSATELGDRANVHPVAEARRMECSTDEHLGLGVFPWQRLHPTSDLGRRSERFSPSLRHAANVSPYDQAILGCGHRGTICSRSCPIGTRLSQSDVPIELFKHDRGQRL